MFISLRQYPLGGTASHALLAALGRLLVRLRTLPAMAMQRVRRIAPEHVILAIMVLALVLFAIVLFTDSTSTGRGGR